jgi:uncharacterized protein with FMN-binding domain
VSVCACPYNDWVSDQGGSHKKLSNSLVALSSAAVLAVYTAGYVRTKSAADRFALQAETRRPVIPAPATAAPVASPVLPAPVTIAATPAAETAAPADAKPPLTVARSTEAATSPSPKARKSARVATPRIAAETPATIPAPAAPAPAPELPAAVVEQVAPMPAPVVPEPPKPQYQDGSFFGWGTSRHGDIQAQVIVEGGRIASATIAQCLTRYSCSVIAKLPPQVAERQSPETDYVSGATQSTNAFYYAVVEALSKAK